MENLRSIAEIHTIGTKMYNPALLPVLWYTSNCCSSAVSDFKIKTQISYNNV
jgi:hypothetical protein